ncbi:BTB/POZ-like [Macleaya cordata]|uniref:BTB/POZ-like n=1 Tax=Macleaya cordata TaxID=56857 RepID=A0A200Q2E7_MACCD|nr:BTB/POZ-like [Macleaya cordata]
MKSSKNGSEKNRKLGNHMVTLHQRLYQALNLGLKFHDKEGKKWQCTDIEIQRLAVRSISAFVGSISPDILKHQIVENSIADILVALEGILQSRNEAVLGLATNVTVKLVGILGSSVLLYSVSELVHSLSSLLSFHQSSIAVSCAISLNHILSKLKPRRFKKHNEVWEILVERKTVDCITCNLHDFVFGSKTLEYFQEMASLLKTIMWQWPPSRYPVWSNAKLLEALRVACGKTDSNVEVAVLQLYSALALCGNGAMKLLENGESLLPTIVHCMGSSQPHSVRVEAFKLAQHLMRSEQGCLTVTKMFCEPIVKATINAMDEWSLSGKVASDQVPLLVEACRLALITRWAGDHHTYFWKFGVGRALLGLLHNNFCKSKPSESFLESRELIAIACEALDSNYNVALRPYIWDVLGWLATYCREDFNPKKEGKFNCLNVLIACACLVFKDSIHKGRQVLHNDVSYKSMYEPASRAVLLMIYSPCEYISSQARHILSKLLTPSTDYLEYLLDFVKSAARDTFCVLDNLRTITHLIHLACYLGLPEYRSFVIQSEAIRTLSTFVESCLSNYVQIQRSKVAPHLHNTSDERTCCWLERDDWEGSDILLFFSLWSLAELIRPSSSVKNHDDLISDQVVDGIALEGSEVQVLVDRLQEISGKTFSSGCRWYAAYILSYFGVYGFPSRLGKRIGKALQEKEHADVLLKLSDGESLSVHGVVLITRCPCMLPTGEFPPYGEKFRREVRLSSRVDSKTLTKLLEFAYLGFVHVGEDLVKQLKILAKACNFKRLSRILCRKRPKWGTIIPYNDFTPALGSAGHHFSDVILEAKVTTGMNFSCSVCSLSISHMHVHKIILLLSCEYLRALFQSGMQESKSQTIKVPVSWDALAKLVNWFYSDELPKPSSGCLWDNMDVKQQLHELHPYVELCWLAEFWFLEDIREDAFKVVVSCLNSSRHLCMEIIRIAADFSQWEIVDVASNLMAPMYPHMRDSGDLESLNDELVDMVRVAYVRLTQKGSSSHTDWADSRATT